MELSGGPQIPFLAGEFPTCATNPGTAQIMFVKSESRGTSLL